MLRIIGPLALAVPLLVLPVHVTAHGAPAPVHTISAAGAGVGMYPAFRPDVDRYALTTGESTGGVVTVTASTSDPAGRVLINGRRDADGVATLSNLQGGDEVSVIIVDSAGTEVHSLVYLPTYFPELTTVVDEPENTAGDVLLSLFNVRTGTGPRPGFETAVDRNGVPRWLWTTPAGQSSLDLKPAGFGGHYTVSRPSATSAGRQGSALVELDEQFRPVRSFETVGLVNTDGHDSILRADGSRILLAYERNSVTDRIDSIIQEVDAAGSVVHTWNSADHMDPAAETTSAATAEDYAHINSIRIMDDGDILASFRNLSSVLKIAWSEHDGFERGDIVWRLGGRHSDFEFVDDPYASGPCAQHTASQLPNGNILIYDNGSVLLGADQSNCVDPANPEGATINRSQTRVTEYALDEEAGTATLDWQYLEGGRFAYFAGSASRLDNGHTVIGWAAAQQAVASEVDATGVKVWEIKTDDEYITYRAVKSDVPDATRPEVAISSPADDRTYVEGTVVPIELACTDLGGSNLRSCDGPTALDTSTPGEHTWSVTATDGAGNTTTVERSYTVAAAAAYRPDAMIKRPGASWRGNNVYGGYRKQRISQTMAKSGAVRTAVVRLQNEANRAERLRVSGTPGGDRFRVRYFVRGDDVTRKVVAGALRTPVLEPRGHLDLKVRVTRRGAARPGDKRTVKVLTTSAHQASRRDAVATVVRATR